MRLWPTRYGLRLGTPCTAIHNINIAAIQQAVTNIYEFSSKFSYGSDTPGGVTIVLFVVSLFIQRIQQPSAINEIFVFSSGFFIRDVDTR